MSHFAYACKTEGKNGISRLISGLCVNCLISIPEYSNHSQSSGCASGVDLFRNFTKLKILNIWIVKYLLNCKRYLSYNFWIFQKISECWVLENLDVHLERTTSELEFWNFQHAFLQFSEHTEISTCFFTVFRTCWKFQHAFL